MPLPNPKKGESKDNFIQRCMANPTMNSEYPKNEQRFAVCNSQWDAKASVNEEENQEEAATQPDPNKPISMSNPPESKGANRPGNESGEVSPTDIEVNNTDTAPKEAEPVPADGIQETPEGGEDAGEEVSGDVTTGTAPRTTGTRTRARTTGKSTTYTSR